MELIRQAAAPALGPRARFGAASIEMAIHYFADAEATIAEEKQQSARQQSGESASGGGGGSADDGIPEDIKEWAARIAAEAREGRTA